MHFWDSKNAFFKSFIHNFGIETDIRDELGKLIISHDIPNKRENMSLDEW